MLKYYRFLDGFCIAACDDTEFTVKLRKASFFPTLSVAEYLSEFAKRTYILYGFNIRTENSEHFVSDLLKHKLLYIQELN